jgi:hypothetical protein
MKHEIGKLFKIKKKSFTFWNLPKNSIILLLDLNYINSYNSNMEIIFYSDGEYYNTRLRIETFYDSLEECKL